MLKLLDTQAESQRLAILHICKFSNNLPRSAAVIYFPLNTARVLHGPELAVNQVLCRTGLRDHLCERFLLLYLFRIQDRIYLSCGSVSLFQVSACNLSDLPHDCVLLLVVCWRRSHTRHLGRAERRPATWDSFLLLFCNYNSSK